MTSKSSSRLGKLSSNGAVSPMIQSKLKIFEGKYNKFITNCSNFFQDSHQSLTPTRLPIKKETLSNFPNESFVLRRKNAILTKTIEDLNSKLLNADLQSSDAASFREHQEKFESKQRLLDRQEEDVLLLKKELEKSKMEINVIKKLPTKENAVQARSATPLVSSSTKSGYLKLPKRKEFKPIRRNRDGSPVSRSVSPQDRTAHKIQTELESLKNELKKTREERNLYKIWKDYCLNHPPVSPAIHSIINHYEIEIKRQNVINSIIKDRFLALIKTTKSLLSQLNLKHKDIKVNDLKADILSKITSMQGLEKEINSKSNLKQVVMMENENKDLEKILRREEMIAELYSEAVHRKSTEINGLKKAFSTMSSLEKNFEAKKSEYQSSVSTPYNSHTNFDISFSNRSKNNIEILFEIFEAFDTKFSKAIKDIYIKVTDKYENLEGIYKKIAVNLLDKFQKMKLFISEKDSLLKKLEQVVIEKDEKIQATLSEVNEHMLIAEKMKTEIKDLESYKIKLGSQFNEKLKEKEVIVLELKHMIMELQEESSDLRKMVENYEVRNLQLNESFKEIEEKYRINISLFLIKEAEIKSLKEKIIENQINISSLGEELRIANNKISELIMGQVINETTLEDEKKSSNLCRSSEINGNSMQKDDEMQSLIASLAEHEVKFQRLTKEHADLQKKYLKISDSYKQTNEQLEYAKKEFQLLKENFQKAENHCQSLIEENENLKNELKGTKPKPETENLKAKLQKSSKTIKDLNEKLIKCRLNYSDLESSYKSLELSLSQSPKLSTTSVLLQCSLTSSTFSEHAQHSISILSSRLPVSTTSSDETLKAVINKNTLLESAYSRLTEEIIAFKESYKEKVEDLTLDKYELSKELNELQKKCSSAAGEVKKAKEEAENALNKQKELSANVVECERKIYKLVVECDEKNKIIGELKLETVNSNNYIQRILKEKEIIENELANITKNKGFDETQARAELLALRTQLSNLDAINTELERAKSYNESKLKKTLNEKSELAEQVDELYEEAESLKQTRSQQEAQISEIDKVKNQLFHDLEEANKTINEYKNQVATYMCNTTALKNELRSLTPQPVRFRRDSANEFKGRICKTAENEAEEPPKADIDDLLKAMDCLTKESVPEKLVNWCKKLLGHENYLLRYSEGEVNISEESKSNLDSMSAVSENITQEMGYRAHSKLIQLKKIIERLNEKSTEKKQKIANLKTQVKTFQNEIKRLDSILMTQKGFDLEYFGSLLQKFVESTKGLDNDEALILQLIFAQLGLKTDIVQAKIKSRKWGVFKKKQGK